MKFSAIKRDNKWKAYVEYEHNDKRKQVIRTPQENTKKSALELAEKLYNELTFNKVQNTNSQTVENFISGWFEKYKSKISFNTAYLYESLIRLYIIPHLGKIRLDKLHSTDIQIMIDTLQETTDLSNTTLKKIYSVLRNSLQYATKHEMIIKNPADNVEKPKQKKFKSRVLNEQEIASLLNHLKKSPIFIPVMISTYTGMRRGEILGLKWNNIDLDKREILVDKQLLKMKGKSAVLVNSTKTEDSTRIISISDGLYRLLIYQQEEQCRYQKMFGAEYNNEGFVNTYLNGKPLKPDYVTHTFKKIVKKLGFPEYRFHDLRHNFATMLLAKGVDLKIISELLGHSSIKVTADIYSHLLKKTKEETVNKINFDLEI